MMTIHYYHWLFGFFFDSSSNSLQKKNEISDSNESIFIIYDQRCAGMARGQNKAWLKTRKKNQWKTWSYLSNITNRIWWFHKFDNLMKLNLSYLVNIAANIVKDFLSFLVWLPLKTSDKGNCLWNCVKIIIIMDVSHMWWWWWHIISTHILKKCVK